MSTPKHPTNQEELYMAVGRIEGQLATLAEAHKGTQRRVTTIERTVWMATGGWFILSVVGAKMLGLHA
jgi:hypothetical protein